MRRRFCSLLTNFTMPRNFLNGKSNICTFFLHYEESWFSNRYKATVILPSRPSWLGGTQLVEGANLTGAKSSNSPYESFFHSSHSSLFTLTQSLLNFTILVLSWLRAFWGALFAKFGGGGHKNVLMDWVLVHLKSEYMGKCWWLCQPVGQDILRVGGLASPGHWGWWMVVQRRVKSWQGGVSVRGRRRYIKEGALFKERSTVKLVSFYFGIYLILKISCACISIRSRKETFVSVWVTFRRLPCCVF